MVERIQASVGMTLAKNIYVLKDLALCDKIDLFYSWGIKLLTLTSKFFYVVTEFEMNFGETFTVADLTIIIKPYQ